MKEKTEIYEGLRVYAMLLVAIAHVTRMYSEYAAIPMPFNPFLAKLTDIIYMFHMPLFFFVSGAVYCACIRQGKYTDTVQFLANKAKRLILPYFVFGFCYVVPVVTLLGLGGGSIGENIRLFLMGLDTRHLWFLLVLFEIFLLMAALRKLLDYKWALFLLLAASMQLQNGFMPPEFALSYLAINLVYFILGMVFHDYREKFSEWMLKYWYITLLAAAGLYRVPSRFHEIFSALAGILISYVLIGKLLRYLRVSKIWNFLSRYTMGIYLFHPMLSYISFFLIRDAGINPYLASVMITVLITAASIGLTEVFRRMHLSVLLGE